MKTVNSYIEQYECSITNSKEEVFKLFRRYYDDDGLLKIETSLNNINEYIELIDIENSNWSTLWKYFVYNGKIENKYIIFI